MFLVVSLAIVAMSGCVDDAADDAGNVTGGDASNDPNTTLARGNESNGSDAEERIDESGAKTGAMPEFEPEPEVEAPPIEHKDPNVAVEIQFRMHELGYSEDEMPSLSTIKRIVKKTVW